MTTPISTTPSTESLHGFQLWLARLVWLLVAGLAVVSLVVAWPNIIQLDAHNFPDLRIFLQKQGLPAGWLSYYTLGWRIVGASVFILAAAFLGWRKANNRMAIITSITCFAFGIGFSFWTFTPEFYQGTVLESAIAWLPNLNKAIGFITSLLMLYLLPNGHFPFAWLRWSALIWSLSWLGSIFFPFLDASNLTYYPFWFFVVFQAVFYGLGLGAQAHYYRRYATPLMRQQMKWLMIGISLTLIGYIISRLPQIFPGNSPLENQIAQALISDPLYQVPRALLGLTLIFAILRYRLWDIDFVINRSLVYGSLTLLLAAIFGLSIYILSRLLPGENAVLTVSLAALAAGATFQPMRTQLKRLVDQKLYHIQINYQPRTPVLTPSAMTFTQAGLGKYKNLELIGRGGMAEVYRAQHPTLNTAVALKILAPQLSNQTEFRRRFEREAQIMSGLEHPHIARVYDYGEEHGTHYIVMEFVKGQDLGHLLKTRGPFGLEQTISILKPIASALDYAHQRGLIHRDVKASNILLEQETERPVLMDFGIAKLTNQTALTGTGGMVGTLDYIAPEQIQGAETLDGRADLYSLSVLAYQLLTGELPFKRQNAGALLMAHLTQPAPDARVLRPELTSACAHALIRGMAKHPADRPASASELIALLA